MDLLPRVGLVPWAGSAGCQAMASWSANKSGRIEPLGRRFFEQVLEEMQPVMPSIPAVSLTEARTRPEHSFAVRGGSAAIRRDPAAAALASVAGSPGS